MRDYSQFLTISYKLKTPYSMIENITEEKGKKKDYLILFRGGARRAMESNGRDRSTSLMVMEGSSGCFGMERREETGFECRRRGATVGEKSCHG